MARVKTVWTVRGPPVVDLDTGELIDIVLQGSVTGDRLTIARENIRADIARLAQTLGTSTTDYTVTINTVEDTQTRYRYVYDIEEAERQQTAGTR